MENVLEMQKINTDAITVPERLATEVENMVRDYSNLVVTEDTLPNIRMAFDTVKTKRVELDNVRKNGTSQFEIYKKQFQALVEKLTNRLIPVENKLKSEINAFEDDDAFKKAEKSGTVAAYQTYLNKFNNPKFEYKGKFVNQALGFIEKVENLKRNQLNSFHQFQFRCNNIGAYKTAADANNGLTNLQNYIVDFENFGENLGQALLIKETAIMTLKQRISELETMEAQQAEIEKQRAEMEKQRLEMEAFNKQKEREQFQAIEREKAEKERIEAIERKEKELIELQQKQERELAEMQQRKEQELIEEKRLQELKEKGLMEIENQTFEIAVIDEIKEFFKTSLNPLTADYTKEAIERMRHQKALGKKTYDDLTDQQRANHALRQNLIESFERLFYSFRNDPAVKEAIDMGILTIQDLKNAIK
jgi:hypothetical protein